MQGYERRRLIVEAIWRIAGNEEAFAIFSDRAEPENYVQMTGDGIVEVTSRDYGGTLPPLDYFQMLALSDLGFAAHPDPNYRKDMVIGAPEEIADLCEKAFEILGCTPAFDLEVEVEEG